MNNSRSQFYALFAFLFCLALLVSNGFVAVFAQEDEADVAEALAPMADVFDEILSLYVEDPDIDAVVEGALEGMMNKLDEHSSYISSDAFTQIQEDTEGEFEGIGVSIQLDDSERIKVIQPIPGSPAFKEGVLGGDIILEIDGVSTKDMAIDEAAKRIRGPRGTTVEVTMWRQLEEGEDGTIEQFKIKRGAIPLESILETRMVRDTVGYIRLADFKKTSADDLQTHMRDLQEQGAESLILDLRWNPGGLLTAAREVSELFLPKGSLVTYTKGRVQTGGASGDELILHTERRPIVPESFPVVILTNKFTASSSEIVTGALQFHKRALVVGSTTYGKGSVQTIIPLRRPLGSALRLTTALYYTPARVTINKRGILPDVAVDVSMEESAMLYGQLRDSYMQPELKDKHNHGPVTGDGLDENGEPLEDTINDIQLERAIEILDENTVFEELVNKYHKSTEETQVASIEEKTDAPEPSLIQN
jgi:carboxyl-terminal processing protease